MNTINAMDWNVEHQCLTDALSITDLEQKLFRVNTKLDRGPVLSENKYSTKTLEGNWFERRATSTPQSNDWRTVYEIDFKSHVNETWEPNQIAKWENKFNLEGLPSGKLFDHKTEYYNNMTTTYDLFYNILPRGLKGARNKSYSARERKWVPEQDLTNSFGSLTQFGLKDAMMKEIEMNSLEGIAKRRWWTTYGKEIGLIKPVNIKLTAKFHRRKVNFNVPDLRHFKRNLSDIEQCLLPLKNKNLISNMKNQNIRI